MVAVAVGMLAVAMVGLLVGGLWLGMAAEAQRHLPDRSMPQPYRSPRAEAPLVEMHQTRGGRWVAEGSTR